MNWKDWEGNSHDLMEILTKNLSGCIEENHKFELGTSKYNLEHYHYACPSVVFFVLFCFVVVAAAVVIIVIVVVYDFMIPFLV
jgi:hypothetical protein